MITNGMWDDDIDAYRVASLPSPENVATSISVSGLSNKYLHQTKKSIARVESGLLNAFCQYNVVKLPSPANMGEGRTEILFGPKNLGLYERNRIENMPRHRGRTRCPICPDQ